MNHELSIEEWLPIFGYEGIYVVSNRGRIKVLKREWLSAKNYSLKRENGEKVLNNCFDKDGYAIVTLCAEGKLKTFRVNRIVATSFILNPDKKPVVNHKDGNKSNNNGKNLEWNTVSENGIHAYANNLQVSKKGESHARSRLKEKDIHEIRRLYKNGLFKHKELAEMFKIHREYCAKIIRKQVWKHI